MKDVQNQYKKALEYLEIFVEAIEIVPSLPIGN